MASPERTRQEGLDVFADIDPTWTEIRQEQAGVGGGRGVFASRDIRAGTIVMAEAPCLDIDVDAEEESQSLHVALARYVLAVLYAPSAQGVSDDSPPCATRVDMETEALRAKVEVLHPRQLADVPAHHLEPWLEENRAVIARVALDDSDEARATAARVLLKCRFNAFGSGLYCTLAMINHHCRPNCTKFSPKAGWSHSEIVAVVDIAQGEELTIS
jgi:hypothetical protein